ncbi:hypothetical protein D3C85_404830 [compost metagenome]
MTVIIIIAVVGLLIYFGTRKKSQQPFVDNRQGATTNNQTNSARQKFQSKISSLPFPDRTDAIVWHINAIESGLTNGDLEFSNLSYAKLIESIRQQNINENGNLAGHLQIIQKEYDDFITYYGLAYPEQFLPPEERKKKKEQEFEKIKEIPIYLETGNYVELPKQILKYVDIVKPLSEWYEIGIKPQKEKYGSWKAIKRQERYFGFYDANLKKQNHKISLETGKRITEKPYFIKALNEQGISLADFVVYGEDLECFVRAVDFFDNQDFVNAQKEIDNALLLKKTEDYEDLKVDIEIKLNNEQVVDEQFEKYKFDIDSAIHSGQINSWLKVLINNNKYEKVISFIGTTNEILDKLIKGEIKHKIYGQQSSDWYEYKKQEFNKNLIYIFDRKTTELTKSENSIKLLELFLSLYSKEDFRPIEKIADQFSSWNLIERANELYESCLKMIEKEDKPRVKSRIEKKIKK